jgi:hypothetical protein
LLELFHASAAGKQQMEGNKMTDDQKRSIMITADQAQAHGRIAVAQWYRCWAETGHQIGAKPDEETNDTIYNGPEC